MAREHEELAAFMARQQAVNATIDRARDWLTFAECAIAAVAFVVAAPAIVAGLRAAFP